MPTIPIVERPYRGDDLETVVRIYTDSIHSLAAAHYSKDQLEAWAPHTPDLIRWGERLAGLNTIIAECNGAPAGFISYASSGYIDLAFTAPRYARCGIAAHLFRFIEGSLSTSGVAHLTVHASLSARSFFERMGFVVDQEEVVECRGALLRRFGMSKPIAASSTPN